MITPTSPLPSPTATVEPLPSPTPVLGARQLLEETIAKLGRAGSYRFTISATHSYMFENTMVEWRYQGQGAYAAPARYEWSIEGQADVTLHVVAVGNQTYCADTRGRQTECSLAWGGPSPGSSPYTLLAYLRNFEGVGQLETSSLEGKDYYHFPFSPSKAEVAALDEAHQAAMASVSTVQGELWVDKATGLPRREKVVVECTVSPGRQQKVEMTLSFFDFGQPVEISLP